MEYAIEFLRSELLRYEKAIDSWEVKSKIIHSDSFKAHNENLSQLRKAINELTKEPEISLRVADIKKGDTFKIQKLIVERDGRISVWCNDWYGHHVIGQDCEFIK